MFTQLLIVFAAAVFAIGAFYCAEEERSHRRAVLWHYRNCGYAAFRTDPRAQTGAHAFHCPHCSISIDMWDITQEEIAFIQSAEGVTRQQYQDLIQAADKRTAAYHFQEEAHESLHPWDSDMLAIRGKYPIEPKHNSAIAHVSEKV